MKQNSQWLSHVLTRSNRAPSTSRPRGRPGGRSTMTSRDRPPESRSRHTDGSSTSSWYSMTSRGAQPLIARIRSPGTTPAASAGDPGATATTTGVDIPSGYRRLGGGPVGWPRCTSTGFCWPTLGGSAPVSKWPSRRSPGWSGPSTSPSTAITRSSTTGWSSSGSRPSGWSSWMTSTRCPKGRR